MPGIQCNASDVFLQTLIYDNLPLGEFTLVAIGADFDLGEEMDWGDLVEALPEDQRKVLSFSTPPGLVGTISQMVADPVTITNDGGEDKTLFGWVVIQDDYTIHWALKYESPKVLVAAGGAIAIQFIHNFDTKPL